MEGRRKGVRRGESGSGPAREGMGGSEEGCGEREGGKRTGEREEGMNTSALKLAQWERRRGEWG